MRPSHAGKKRLTEKTDLKEEMYRSKKEIRIHFMYDDSNFMFSIFTPQIPTCKTKSISGLHTIDFKLQKDKTDVNSCSLFNEITLDLIT